MSTERMRCRVLAAAIVLVSAGCMHGTTSRIAAVCTGANVGKRLTLIVDSVSPAAGRALERLHGQSYDIVLNLSNGGSSTNCQDRYGSGSVSVGELPDALAASANKHGDIQWRVDSLAVAVNLNPGVYDNNLQFVLPLSGGPGSWFLSTFIGRIASGRLLP